MTVALPQMLELEAAGAAAECAVRVEELGPGLETAWDEVVRLSPGSSVFHLLGWRQAVERTLGHRALYLVARRGCRLVGLLPLFEVDSMLAGHALVSVPFGVRGGILAEDDGAQNALMAAAQRLAAARRVDYLELRSEKGLDRPDLVTKRLYVTFRADLTQPDHLLLGRMDRKRRQMLHYAKRAGYECRAAGAESLPEFYRLFCLSMRHHGTPPYPQRFLDAILECLPSNLYFLYHQGRPLAAALNLFHQGTLMPFYAGGERSPRLRGVDDFLYWSLMRWGREHGYHTFDFGRSRVGTGAHAFKARWGMTEVPLEYQTHLVGAAEPPNVSPANPRYAPLIALWRRLPLPLTRWLGAPIIRRLP